MKYGFSILVPHPDDEFIGCYQFIQRYKTCINNIIFVTNGERSVTNFPDMVEYLKIRRMESQSWISETIPNCEIHYLNVPDDTTTENINNSWTSKLFYNINGQSPLFFLLEKTRKIVGSNIVLLCNLEKHPSHELTFTLGSLLSNKKVYYQIHPIMINNIEHEAGTLYNKINVNKEQYFNYYYVFNDQEIIEKRKLFQLYYYSQYTDFLKTGVSIGNWETYLSEVPLLLSSEDKTYPLTQQIRFI